jgi:hypothetical protein
VRTYFDAEGTGVFDVMHVNENGIMHQYYLNGLIWEKFDD